MKARNVLTDIDFEFDKRTTPEWAVAYGYCEEHNRMSELFSAAQDGQFIEFAKTLPLVFGDFTVSCGDWVALKVK